MGREEFSAAPDAGWPDCFNSGVFVFRPNLNTFKDLVKHAMARGSFDGGDQGLLNTFLPAYKYFGKQVKIVHFIGATKPWLVSFDEAGNARIGRPEKHTHLYLKLWWQIFNNSVRPLLNRAVPSNSGLVCLGTVTSADYMASPPSPGAAV